MESQGLSGEQKSVPQASEVGEPSKATTRVETELDQKGHAVTMEDQWQARDYYAKGHSAMKKKQLEAAIQHYSEAIRFNPGYAEAHNSLAIAYTFSGRFEEAVKNYDAALRLWPDYEEAKRNREVVAEMIGKPPEEQKKFLESLKYQVGK